MRETTALPDRSNWLSPAAIAQASGYHRNHVGKALRTGALPAPHPYPGAHWRVDPAVVNRWIEDGCPAKPTPDVTPQSVRAS